MAKLADATDLKSVASKEAYRFDPGLGDHVSNMPRPIKFQEAYQGLRNEGLGIISSAFVAVVWLFFGVKVESVKNWPPSPPPVSKPIVDIQDAFVCGPSLWGYPVNYPQSHVPDGHRVTNGKMIRTSTIIKVQGDIVETERTIYNVLNWDDSLLPRPQNTHPAH